MLVRTTEIGDDALRVHMLPLANYAQKSRAPIEALRTACRPRTAVTTLGRDSIPFVSCSHATSRRVVVYVLQLYSSARTRPI